FGELGFEGGFFLLEAGGGVEGVFGAFFLGGAGAGGFEAGDECAERGEVGLGFGEGVIGGGSRCGGVGEVGGEAFDGVAGGVEFASEARVFGAEGFGIFARRFGCALDHDALSGGERDERRGEEESGGDAN